MSTSIGIAVRYGGGKNLPAAKRQRAEGHRAGHRGLSSNIKQLPAGITPPLVLSYSATNMPVLSLGLSGLSEQELNDYALNFIRTQLRLFLTVPGAAVPYPYGGKQRYLEIDLDYKALQGYGLTPYRRRQHD